MTRYAFIPVFVLLTVSGYAQASKQYDVLAVTRLQAATPCEAFAKFASGDTVAYDTVMFNSESIARSFTWLSHDSWQNLNAYCNGYLLTRSFGLYGKAVMAKFTRSKRTSVPYDGDSDADVGMVVTLAALRPGHLGNWVDWSSSSKHADTVYCTSPREAKDANRVLLRELLKKSDDWTWWERTKSGSLRGNSGDYVYTLRTRTAGKLLIIEYTRTR